MRASPLARLTTSTSWSGLGKCSSVHRTILAAMLDSVGDLMMTLHSSMFGRTRGALIWTQASVGPSVGVGGLDKSGGGVEV